VGTIYLWEVSAASRTGAASGPQVRTLNGHVGLVVGVAFSPDSRFLASAGQDQTVRVWDVATGQEVRTFRGPQRVVRSPRPATLLTRTYSC
jgi:WD40 repeat protein